MVITAMLMVITSSVAQHQCQADQHELHDFGKALATGLCKLPGMHPIVSFPQWGEEVTPDQPNGALWVLNATAMRPFEGVPEIVFANLVCVQSI